MKRIEIIADFNTEQFIKKHFSNLKHDDKMVMAIRNSVRETIRKALVTYELEKVK
ncbi:MAG: hypothetical protein JW731_14740 [Bacteroidales bacterium]|nr:hypothetical protein [Bacteroidales bacterium]